MSCGRDITYSPIQGGYDARTVRGAVSPSDFELVFNMDGGTATGYSRLSGWTRYRHADACGPAPLISGPPGPVYDENGNYNNQDLHDQMFVGSSIAGGYLVDVTGNTVGTPGMWYAWSVRFTTNQLAMLIGKVELWVSYNSVLGPGQAVGRVDVTTPSVRPDTILVIINLPWDAMNIKALRIVGNQVSPLNRTVAIVPAGTGSVTDNRPVPSFDNNACTPYTMYPNSQISLLTSIVSTFGRRRLLAATRSTIFVNDDQAGNWRILADGLGGYCQTGEESRSTEVSFKMAQIGNIVLLTNGFDLPLYWKMDTLPEGPQNWSADYILELQSLRIQSAKVIAKHDGFAIIGNVIADGRSEPSRLYWSDYNDPLSWIPGGESAAGYHDFGRGEVIVVAASIGGKLRVYTDQAIYDGTIVEDSRVWAFTEIYRAEQGERLIRYPNSFVNTGSTHLWMGADSIYTMESYDRSPKRNEWIHRVAGAIFNGVPSALFTGIPDAPAGYAPIDRKHCHQPVGGFDPVREVVWFSWPESGSTTNNVSLAIWPMYGKASLVDQGFTAFTAHRPDPRQSLRDWVDSTGICNAANLLLPKEGAACNAETVQTSFPYFINPTEDIYGEIDPLSALAATCGTCPETLCNQCDSDIRFLMATVDPNGADISIKEMVDGSCVRHRLTGRVFRQWPTTSVECHLSEGYLSVLQQGPSKFGENGNKTVTGMVLQISSPDQSPPGQIFGQVGTSDIPSGVLWVEAENQNLGESDPEAVCFTDEEQPGDPPCVKPKAPRYDYPYDFPFYAKGEYVAWRIFADGLGSCFSISGATLRINFGARCK